jgi:hypothetical protein
MATETVQFRQNLIQGLFSFVVTAAYTGAAHPADGVQFIDENNCRSTSLSAT